MRISRNGIPPDASLRWQMERGKELRQSLQQKNISGIKVEPYRIEEVPADSDIIAVHKGNAARAALTRRSTRVVWARKGQS